MPSFKYSNFFHILMLPASRYDFFGHCKRGINKMEVLPRGFIVMSGVHVYHFYPYSTGQRSVIRPDCKGLGNKILPESPEKRKKMDSHTELHH